ncbi:hypothetical protein FOMPIDRAFT_1124373 [Fomitopsis schrenkii]|uniref:NAD-binding protein n=1 Tax=Fomitopsis schrenkii TaxID=2126942 RepID=S8FMM9_FOMSC|nr:hypothetical protein FOMPIDRAFT_1124373 [Fomitopsis schrenkii]
MDTTTTWLITGASRGLGLGLTRSLSASPSNIVIATCRNPASASELNALQADVRGRGQDNLRIVQLDVNDEASIRASVAAVERTLEGRGLDVLYNNAGIVSTAYLDGAFDCDYGHMMAILKTNVVAPALLGKAYLLLLDLGTRKTIVNVSSARGSIGGCLDVRNAVYSLSKSALNMLSHKQAIERPDLIVISLCPGHVQTDLGESGGAKAPLTVEESVAGQLHLVQGLTHEQSGRFWQYNGKDLLW